MSTFRAEATTTTLITEDVMCVEVWWTYIDGGHIEGVGGAEENGPCRIIVGPIGAALLGPEFPLEADVNAVERAAYDAHALVLALRKR